MSGSDAVPKLPTELAPDASIGEVRGEIDNARHDAARTVAALVDRFTVGEQARRQVRGAVRVLSWDPRRVGHDFRVIGGVASAVIPPGLAETGKNAIALLGRLPLWVRLGVPAFVLVRVAFRRRHR